MKEGRFDKNNFPRSGKSFDFDKDFLNTFISDVPHQSTQCYVL